jgi:hypothetical protein
LRRFSALPTGRGQINQGHELRQAVSPAFFIANAMLAYNVTYVKIKIFSHNNKIFENACQICQNVK